MTPVSDKELWDAVRLDDARAFAVLYKRYWGQLHATVNYYLKDFQAAEQIVQDIFFILWKRRQALEILDFGAYFHTMARYHVFKQLKIAKKNIVDYMAEIQDDKVPITFNHVESKMDSDYLHSELSQYLSELPRRCREIFWMSRIEQLSNDEISERLGISKRTVENQITQAQKHLRLHATDIALALLTVFLITSNLHPIHL